MSARRFAIVVAVCALPVLARAQRADITELEHVDVRASLALDHEYEAATAAMVTGDFGTAQREYEHVARGIDEWFGNSAPTWLLAERAAYARNSLLEAVADARRAEHAAASRADARTEAQAVLDQYALAADMHQVGEQALLRTRLRGLLDGRPVGGDVAARIAEVVDATP